MATRIHVYTPLSERTQCIKICVLFPRHVFKDVVLFSALLSLSKSICTENPRRPGQFRLSSSFWYLSSVDLFVTRLKYAFRKDTTLRSVINYKFSIKFKTF